MAALKSIAVYETQENAVETNSCVDVDNVDSAHVVWDSPDLIDLAEVTPCPQCGSLEKWWPAIGEPRCQKCDALTAWRAV